jgi:hypothetical protein
MITDSSSNTSCDGRQLDHRGWVEVRMQRKFLGCAAQVDHSHCSVTNAAETMDRVRMTEVAKE